MDINISSSIVGHNGSFDNPSWDEVNELLEKLNKHDGTISLSMMNKQGFGVDYLEVRAEAKRYLVTMLENISEDDEEIRTYTNHNLKCGENKTVEILGELWDTSMIAGDIQIVKEIFNGFYQDGRVSLELLS